MEEPEDIAEEFCIHQEDDLKEDVYCAVKTKQEADKLAIELLAMRLECYYIDFCFRTCPGCKKIFVLFLKHVFFLCRAFTAVEMRKKLQGKRFSPDIVEAVVDDFQSRCKHSSGHLLYVQGVR